MTHEQRQALIRQPFLYRIIPPSKGWGGCSPGRPFTSLDGSTPPASVAYDYSSDNN